jgi:hypothetical protein
LNAPKIPLLRGIARPRVWHRLAFFAAVVGLVSPIFYVFVQILGVFINRTGGNSSHVLLR